MCPGYISASKTKFAVCASSLHTALAGVVAGTDAEKISQQSPLWGGYTASGSGCGGGQCAGFCVVLDAGWAQVPAPCGHPCAAGFHCALCVPVPAFRRSLKIPLRWRGGRRSLTGWFCPLAQTAFASPPPPPPAYGVPLHRGESGKSALIGKIGAAMQARRQQSRKAFNPTQTHFWYFSASSA